ncbi:MAG: ankyrin repeat domain-containing protein [Vicinamibacteria bacterium]|nr:ankyrin repeat domain-containing protein [Vicinamibacteria bacterium]
MPERRLPVRPDLDQLKRQAKELLKAIRRGDPDALAELRVHHPEPPTPAATKLADAQLALARAYEAPSWMRLAQACELVDGIWRDDAPAVLALIRSNPKLLTENTLIRKSDWGPPLSYAANLGRDGIIEALHGLGASDLEHALGRAVLQSQIGAALKIHALMGSPPPPKDALGGPAYTLSTSGTELMLKLGAPVRDAHGRRLAPVDVVLETDSRRPEAKHAILEMYVEHGLELPDTPTMALHRGRVDLLEAHLRRDPRLLNRTFTHEDIYPESLGCHDEIQATHGTPLRGATLLHMSVDYAEMEIARWLIERGADVNARAAVDEDGFGGHTPLFATVVSQPNFWMNHHHEAPEAPFTKLLLDHGADPNVRASLRKQLHPGYGPDTMHEYRDVTALSWGRRFHRRIFVSEPAMKLIEEAGGAE